MARQSIYFLTDRSHRVEVHVREDRGGLQVELAFHPPRDPAPIAATDADALADEIETRVRGHFEEHGSRLIMIKLRRDAAPLTYFHLGRYGVPLLPEAEPST